MLSILQIEMRISKGSRMTEICFFSLLKCEPHNLIKPQRHKGHRFLMRAGFKPAPTIMEMIDCLGKVDFIIIMIIMILC